MNLRPHGLGSHGADYLCDGSAPLSRYEHGERNSVTLNREPGKACAAVAPRQTIYSGQVFNADEFAQFAGAESKLYGPPARFIGAVSIL
jgi:hypothetical protein